MLATQLAVGRRAAARRRDRRRRPGGGAREGAAPVAVTTAPVVAKPMAVKVRAVGNVEASSTVDVRVAGLRRAADGRFTEGQDVTAGQLLFTIDPRAVRGALKQAEAALARDTAQREESRSAAYPAPRTC